MIAIAGFERRLEQVFHRLADGDGWEHLLNSKNGDFHIRANSATSLLVSHSYNLNASLDRAMSLLRPEAMCVREHPFMESICHKCIMLKSFAPGDVICSARVVHHYAVLMYLLVARQRTPATDLQDFLVRMTFRRDFPCAGEASLAMIDMDNSSDRTTDSGLVLSGTDDPLVCQMREVFEMPRVPSWLLKSLLWSYSRGWDSPFTMLGEVSSLTHQIIEEEAGFVVVTLKKCPRGLPLVPSTAKAPEPSERLNWEPRDDPTCFTLSSYLQLLLSACGLDPASIFDSLDGRYLVPFQAAVKRSLWPLLWQTLDGIFKEQRTAYRRLYGGSGAPHIQADVAPRFHTKPVDMPPTESKEWPGQTSSPDEEGCEDLEGFEDLRIYRQVKNSFIHFAPYEYQCDQISVP